VKPYELTSHLGGSKPAYLDKTTVIAFSAVVIAASEISHPL
jgi:hypothetical protein